MKRDTSGLDAKEAPGVTAAAPLMLNQADRRTLLDALDDAADWRDEQAARCGDDSPCALHAEDTIKAGAYRVLAVRLGEAAPGMNGPVPALRQHIEDLSRALTVWAARDDTRAQPQVTRSAGTAVDAIDDLLRDLHRLREQLVSESRQHQDAGIARADALLAGTRARLASALPAVR
ncbi:MAG TPA: hypothetical protein VNF47_23230 [Streptosporangiaceae bacterium]|nr:hypothetical protein [Streptosporangiaceae bacterium]